MTGKYQPLEDHLRTQSRDREHVLSFARIAAILGADLPPSAARHQAWWANQRGAGHVQSHAWLNAGFHSCDLDLKAREVTFRPVALPREPTRLAAVGRADRPLTVAEAKRGLSLHFGVPIEAIEIQIRA